MEYRLYLPYNLEPFNISPKWTMLNFINKEIQNELRKNEQYTLKSQVKKESFQLILDYLSDGKRKPIINDSNRSDLFLLCTEFQIWENLFPSTSYLDKIKILKEDSNPNIPNIQKIIAKDLDQYLVECGDELFQVPIQRLNVIFGHPERNLTKHNLCYNLILRNYEKNKNKNIFILLPYLDGNKLDKNNLNDAILNCQYRIGFIPKIEIQYISNLNENFDRFQKEQQNINMETKQRFDNQQMMIDQLKEEQKNSLKNDQEKTSYESEILKIKREFEEKLREQKEESEKRIKQLEDIIKNHNKQNQ